MGHETTSIVSPLVDMLYILPVAITLLLIAMNTLLISKYCIMYTELGFKDDSPDNVLETMNNSSKIYYSSIRNISYFILVSFIPVFNIVVLFMMLYVTYKYSKHILTKNTNIPINWLVNK